MDLDESDILALFEKHVRHHLGCPGGRAWYLQFQQERGFPPFITQYINNALNAPGTQDD